MTDEYESRELDCLIDTKELVEAFKRFFNAPKLYGEVIDRRVEQWRKEEDKKLEKHE